MTTIAAVLLLPVLSMSMLVSPSSSPINSVQGASSITTGPSGITYAGYVESDLSVWIAWRSPSDPPSHWSRHQLLPFQLNDAHQTVSIAESADGHVHVCAATHNSLLRYWRTTNILDPDTLVESSNGIDTPGSSSNQISYPTLIPAGNNLWLIYRYGTSGAGDTHLARYSAITGTWSDVSTPLIRGRLLQPGVYNDSQYIGNPTGLPNGDILLTWTARVSEPEPVNRGVFWAQVSSSGDVYTAPSLSLSGMPLTRFTAGNVLGDDLADNTLSNSGLSITKTASSLGSSIHIGFNRYSSQGYREIYHARSMDIGQSWAISQVSNHRALNTPSTRICEVAPLPCGLEIQGPQLISANNDLLATDNDNLSMIYTVATTPVTTINPGTWARLPGEMYIARSSSNGESWTVNHVRQDIAQVSGEYPRDTSGRAQVLSQSLIADPGALTLLDLSAIVNLPSPALSIDAGHLDASRELSIPRGSISHSGQFSVRVQFSPSDDRIMALAGIEGEWRLFYFGADTTGGSHGTGGNLQVISWPAGEGSRYIQAGDMNSGEMIDIVLVADGLIISIYRDGALLGTRSLPSAISNTMSALWIGGLAGYPQYRFKGEMEIEYFDEVLSAGQVLTLYDLGPAQ